MKIKGFKNIFTKKGKKKEEDELMKQFQIVYDNGNKLLNQLLNDNSNELLNQLLNGGIKNA